MNPWDPDHHPVSSQSLCPGLASCELTTSMLGFGDQFGSTSQRGPHIHRASQQVTSVPPFLYLFPGWWRSLVRVWADTAKDLQAHSSATQQAQRGHSGGLAPSLCCQSHHIASGSQDGKQLAEWRIERRCRAEAPPAVWSDAGYASAAGRCPG